MKNTQQKLHSETNKFIQWTATSSVFMLTLQLGIGIGWASPNNARLLTEGSSITATEFDVSWMTSLASLGSAIGSILGALSMEYAGSRRTILMTYALVCAIWVCLLAANSVEWLYVSRFAFGICCAMLFSSFPIYLGEISDSQIRGSLISLAMIGSPVGVVLATIAETYLSMKTTASMYLVLALIGILLFFWLGDTPYYLIKKNNQEAAMVSINFYRGGSSEKELDEIVNFVKNSDGLKDKLGKLRLPVVRKSIFMIMLIFALPHLAGYMNIMTYMEIIFKSAKFPENIKSIAVCAASLSVAIFGFIVAKAYQPIVDYAGEAYAFWLHAAFGFFGVPCTLFLIIETKGKTFQEIQDQLSKK